MGGPSERALGEARRAADGARADMVEITRRLARWVERDSPSGDRGALDALAAELAADCAEAGLEPELVPAPAGLHLHAAAEGAGSARIALLCHHDTVFPQGTARERGFRRQGNRALGPGVADMKAGIACALAAARSLLAGPRPFGRLELVSVPDEEVRAGPFATLDRLAGFDAALCLECARADGSIVSARKGGAWVRVSARGRAAHAGVEPHLGRNAITALCGEALRAAALDGARPGLSVTVTQIGGGDVINAVPAEAWLTLDARAEHEADLDWLLERLDERAPVDGVELRTRLLDRSPPLERTPAVAALARMATELGAALGESFRDTATGGASDASRAAARGIAALDGLGPVGGLDHTPDEYVELDTLPSRCGVLAGLVAAVDDGSAGRA